MPTTNRTDLIRCAVKARRTAVASSWLAHYVDHGAHGLDSAAYVEVHHYSTPMFAVVLDGPHEGAVVPISRGWGSMTDKCGVGIILRGWGASVSTYRDLYDGTEAPHSHGGVWPARYPRPFPHPEAVAADRAEAAEARALGLR